MFSDFLIVPVVVVFTLLVCRWIMQPGLAWSGSLRAPSWTPARRTVSIAWIGLGALVAISAILAFEAGGGARPQMLAALFGVNAFLNVAWTFLFFRQRQIGSASLEALLLALSIAMLIGNVYPLSAIAALLLIPYFLFALFVAALAYAIFRLNP